MGRPLMPIIGKRFGRLIVLKRVENRYNGKNKRHPEAWFLVRCDCGKKFETRGYTLRKRKANTACRTCKPLGFRHGMFGTKEYQIWNSIQSRAAKKGMKFNLDVTDIHIPKRCPLLGIRICLNNTQTKFNSPSIDRINNKKGYVKDNVWVISTRANAMKNDASLFELQTLVKNMEKKPWLSFT
jgi:hypothetical protein